MLITHPAKLQERRPSVPARLAATLCIFFDSYMESIVSLAFSPLFHDSLLYRKIELEGIPVMGH